MATAPFPFFYSPTYAYATFPSIADPAYLPHSVSPAPPIVAGPSSYIYPSAATYPPPPFPDGYSTSTYSLPSTAYHHSFPSQIHTQNCQNWPPAAPTPIHGDLHHHHFLPTHDHLTVEATPQPSAASTAPSRELCPPQPLASATRPDPTHLNEFALQLKIAHRSLLNISRQLDEYQAKSECSYAYLKREISKLVERVPSSKSSTTTAPTPSVAFTPSSASAAMAESSRSVLSKTAPAYVVPQVLDEMPQCYSLHNLKRQTVFRADGSEHSYYMLPEESPVEKATPSILPPAGKNVGVMASRFVQAQAARMASVVQDDPIGLKEMQVSDVSEEEKQQQDSENALINVQQLGAPRLNVLVIHERINEWDPGIHALPSSTPDRDIRYCRVPSRLINHEVQFLWDPGAAAFLMNPLNDGSSNDPIGNEHVGQLVSSTGDFFSHGTTKQWSQYKQQYIVLPGVFTEIMLDIPPAKPPKSGLKTAYCQMRAKCFIAFGLEWTEVSASVLFVLAVHCSKSTSATMSNTTCVWDPGIQFILSMLWWLSKGTGHVFRHLLAVKFGTHTYTYFGNTAASMCCPPANLIPHRRKFAVLPQFGHSILLSSVVCVCYPGIALVYQQSVQMNYIARNLLSSHNYLQIMEMDIIFITFLPP